MATAYTRTPFFSRSDNRATIEGLAEQRRVTIVVGAGASAEVGLPLWSDLVERLLLRGMSPETDPDTVDYPPAVVAAARRAIQNGGALSAATMARAALGDRFTEELRLCLYKWPNRWQWRRPGATAEAVARLFRVMTERGQTCEVATTNYDDKLEQALREEMGQEVRSLCTDAEDKDGALVVRHLHGVLTEDGDPQDVTLTEADYHSAEAGLPWQEAYMRRRLEDSTVIFIGASLTDQHLLRYIFRYASEDQPAVALMVEDADGYGPADEHRPPQESDTLLTDLKRGRWHYAHLTALQADFRCQPAQFLCEVAHRKTTADTTSYGSRLDSWFDEFSKERLGLASASDFALSQHDLQEIVEEWRDTVATMLEDAGYDPDRETLEVHLWCRTPDRLRIGTSDEAGPHGPVSSMGMVACSDRIWADPRAIDTRLITQPSTRAAVDAFCWGTPQVQLPQGSQKWQWILATPVVLEDGEASARLPVGAVTLVSDQPLNESFLGHLNDADQLLLADIEKYLASVAGDTLDPSKSSD